MWCWHRIRESESGLCPACRTPYGEDPHQFSAVDVEEVLKANKEKEAAAKRERQRQTEEELVEVPKDRTQLANMRVIRRNLVYAVGLPPAIATEEILRRPEYFGQYGKIAKIVINRTQVVAGADPRRASASAYVTFAHKEDTLACILALDGFYLENRNIRASYGTSKYCSAFIKNVRCNNPECTYLHDMGSPDDTFTKQEIQAGYVTSGRDVLARQQQILAEQLRLGTGTGIPRKKQGAGGPSGSGKPSPNPVFPVPEYDEPAKPTPPLVPTAGGLTRSVTTVSNVTLNAANISAKLGRSQSLAVGNGTGGKSPPLEAVASTHAPPTHRKTHSSSTQPLPGTTAASVVAAGRSLKAEATDSHATLTPLTPLKRSTKSSSSRAQSVGAAPSSDASVEKLTPLRNGANKKNGVRSSAIASAPSLPTSQLSSTSEALIGGDVIGPLMLKPRAGNALAGLGGDPLGPSLDSLGGHPFASSDAPVAGGLTSALGGQVFTGELQSASSKSAIGASSGDKWNVAPVGGLALSTGPMLGGESDSGLWGSASAPSHLAAGPAPVGGSVIGGSRALAPVGNSTSALASMLGVNLPTGSGSLFECSSSLWSDPASSGPSALSALNSSAFPGNESMGGQPMNGSISLIGGVPIGGARPHDPGTIGGGGQNDIYLLQSLLPGVHITRGEPSGFVGGFSTGWNGGSPGPAPNQGYGSNGIGGESINGNWNGGLSGGFASPGGSVGAIGQNGSSNQRRGPGIW